MNAKPSHEQLEQLYFRTKQTLRNERLRRAEEICTKRLVALWVIGIGELLYASGLKTAEWPWWGEWALLLGWAATLSVPLALAILSYERAKALANKERIED